MATIAARLQAEIDRANAVTGKEDATVHNAVGSLIEGYGQGSAPVLEEKTVTANGVYTPPSGVDGFSKVTVNMPQSGGPTPFTVAWGTVLPEAVVENQFFLVCHPENPELYPAIHGAVVVTDNTLPDYPEWMQTSGMWIECFDDGYSWNSADYSYALQLNCTLMQQDTTDEPLRIQVGGALLLIYPDMASQANISLAVDIIPSYIGRNGKWERFCSALYQEGIDWPV